MKALGDNGLGHLWMYGILLKNIFGGLQEWYLQLETVSNTREKEGDAS